MAWSPNWAVHPGQLLKEDLESRGMSQAEFARKTGLTEKLISTIIAGTNPVTAKTALRLERVLGTKAHMWLNVQARYDLFEAQKEEACA